MFIKIDYKVWIGVLVIISLYACSGGRENKNGEFNETYSKFDGGINIPVAGNSWIVDEYQKSSDLITKSGINNWSCHEDTLRTFFHTPKTGVLRVGIRAKAVSESSIMEIKLDDQKKNISLEPSDDFQNIFLGQFDVTSRGYQEIDLYGVSKEGECFPEISHIIIDGEAAPESVKFVKDDFYWGRRGPSVHLRYEVSEDIGKVEYFYNEITVPEGNDVIGSYFMANGFAHGYFGIQVNSQKERRILFSVWSPHKTDNPDEIPEDKRIVLLDKGEDVYAGKFGNEGSGGQSYKKFMWETGKTYGFLLRGVPSGDTKTTYTAWFFDPKVEQWSLIASFQRPETNTYLTHFHSFLENFIPDAGALPRKGLFSNQWLINTKGEWYEISNATFTADATARKDARLDYLGGTDNNSFFLKNCGFFDERTNIGTSFSRPLKKVHPEIDFYQLPGVE